MWLFPLLQVLLQALQLIVTQSGVFQNVQDQQLVRVVKQPLDQVPYFGASRLGALHHRRVNVSSGVFGLGVGDVTLLLKNADGGEHRVVGQQLLAGEIVKNLLNGGRTRCQRTSMSLSSASVSVAERFGGTFSLTKEVEKGN